MAGKARLFSDRAAGPYRSDGRRRWSGVAWIQQGGAALGSRSVGKTSPNSDVESRNIRLESAPRGSDLNEHLCSRHRLTCGEPEGRGLAPAGLTPGHSRFRTSKPGFVVSTVRQHPSSAFWIVFVRVRKRNPPRAMLLLGAKLCCELIVEDWFSTRESKRDRDIDFYV